MIKIETTWRDQHSERRGEELDFIEEELAEKLKQAARFRQPNMVNWYIEQLADHLADEDTAEAS